MAFIQIQHLKNVGGQRVNIQTDSSFKNPFGYYKEDIELLLAQRNARSLLQVTAKCVHPDLGEIETKVLIATSAVNLTDENGVVVDDSLWIKGPSNVAALPCPRFIRNGLTQILADGSVVAPTSIGVIISTFDI
jgi:hypothetical protein